MAGLEGNRTLKQDQVQQFLDHAAKTHDEKVTIYFYTYCTTQLHLLKNWPLALSLKSPV